MPKVGRLSDEEMSFIQNNAHIHSPRVLAQKLDRKISAIKNAGLKLGVIFKQDDSPISEEQKEDGALSILHNAPEWQLIRLEFDSDEITYFRKRFSALMGQFKEDIYPVELTQIFQLIKFEILMSRNLIGSQETKEEIARIKEMTEDMYKAYDGNIKEMPKDMKDLCINFENQISGLRGAQENKSKEYADLQKQHSALMRELKATRDQRINKIIDSKRNYLDVIKEFQNEDIRRQEGRQNELVKLSIKKESERLSEYHEYQNKELDKPILNSETIGEEDDD